MTETQTGAVAGFFEKHSDAEKAVSALQQAGFGSAHIGVAHTDTASGSTTRSAASTTDHSKAGDNEPGVWDKVKNFFDADSAEPYADERQKGDLASRTVTSVDSPQDYSRGDLHGTFSGMSLPDEQSRYFDHRLSGETGGAVVTVNAGARRSEAEAILVQHGADIGDDASDYAYDDSNATTATAGTQNIQLLGEVLRVHKDRVSRGEVRLRKEVITEMQTIQVPVTREELVIERHAVTGTQTASGEIGEMQEMRIPLTEERAGVDKSTFVREEVSVGKREVESVRDVADQVRHEELIVEDETKSNR